MSKTKNAITSNLSIIVAVVVLLSVASVLGSRGDTSTAAGVLTGGALAVAALLVARARARRRPDDAGTVDRVVAGTADERDKAVQQGTYAFTGLAPLVLTCAGSVAATLGVATLSYLPYCFFNLLMPLLAITLAFIFPPQAIMPAQAERDALSQA